MNNLRDRFYIDEQRKAYAVITQGSPMPIVNHVFHRVEIMIDRIRLKGLIYWEVKNSCIFENSW